MRWADSQDTIHYGSIRHSITTNSPMVVANARNPFRSVAEQMLDRFGERASPSTAPAVGAPP